MSVINKQEGISPVVKEEFGLRDLAMVGDIVMVITPTTVAPVPTTSAWTRDVKISLQTAAGAIHTWLDTAVATILSIGDTSTAGTASIVSTTITLVEGETTVVVSGDAAD